VIRPKDRPRPHPKIGRVAKTLSPTAPTVGCMNTQHDLDGSRRAVRATGHETPPAGNVSVIAAELTTARCRWCNDDLEHCHESLVVHAIGDTHCMDAGCRAPTEAHHMVVGCDEFGCTCAQTSRIADSA
jgi:hypothetical protein